MAIHLFTWLRGAIGGPGRRQLEDFGVEEIVTEEQWAQTLAASGDGLFIFKHSTTCPISAAAYREVGNYVGDGETAVLPVYLVKVIESRPVSNAIAAQLGVTHQSPQVILLKQGKSVWNASHGAITARALRDAAKG